MTVPARLAIFDVDGTLIDSQHNIITAMTTAFRANNLDDPRPEAVRRIIGLSLIDAVARLLPADEADVHRAVAHAYKETFPALMARPAQGDLLFPGAAATLKTLADDGWLLGIATGKSRRGVDAMIARHGFEGLFVTQQTADDNPGKPHPGMVLRALDETGVDAANAVMIGDTTFDMLMGREAKVHAVGVGWGYHPPDDLRAAGAQLIADSYEELPSRLVSAVKSSECVLAQS